MDEQILVNVAHALADETRLWLLGALADGDAAVSELAARSGLPQPRVSTHLTVLREAGLVTVTTEGRQRAYHVDAERLRNAFSALRSLSMAEKGAPGRSKQGSRLVKQNQPIRQARTCYDHLAGVAGVSLFEGMLHRGWLTRKEGGVRLLNVPTAEGAVALRRRGVAIPNAQNTRRLFARSCVDWTERKPHLDGALGAAILIALQEAGIVERAEDTRVVSLPKPLDEWLSG
jgi:DNA-binding transcriptional ArsR family regulator